MLLGAESIYFKKNKEHVDKLYKIAINKRQLVKETFYDELDEYIIKDLIHIAYGYADSVADVVVPSYTLTKSQPFSVLKELNDNVIDVAPVG